MGFAKRSLQKDPFGAQEGQIDAMPISV
jgi:hypothetical protein